MDQPPTPSGNWGRLWDVFHQALERDASARASFLDEACNGDATLRREIDELLAAHDSSSSLDRSPIRHLRAGRSSPRPAADGDLLAPGDVLADRFEIVRCIGRGGMGTTYEARDCQLGVGIALKTLRPEIAQSPVAVQRFRREIALGRRITHRNVCRIFDLVESTRDHASGETIVFLTMELLAGETLAERLRRDGPLPLDEALVIARQIGDALGAAHRAEVIHRDLKPSNVMLVREADGTRAVVTDFGIAKLATTSSGEAGASLTGAGQLIGTPEYMAPEQLEGYVATPLTDVYAFGMLLYEITTGRLPFDAGTPFSTALRRLTHPLPSPRQHRPEVGVTWERVILACLERHPRDRFQTIAEVIAALDRGWTRGFRFSRRARVRAVVGASAVLVLIALIVAPRGWAGRPPLPFQQRDWVLIGDFENRTGEPVFDGSIEHALEAELSNSQFVNVVPRERVADTLRLMARPVDTRVDVALGREICLRDGDIRVMVTGRTERIGPRYVLSVSLMDPTAGRRVISSSEEASGQEQIWPAVRRLSTWVRERLGEELSSIEQRGTEVPKVTTRSLRALQLYAQHQAPETRRNPKAQEQLLREALKEDAEFAMAHVMLAYTLQSLGRPRGEWQPLAQRALDLSGRVSERERYRISGYFYGLTGEDQHALPFFEAYAQRYPDDLIARQELGNRYWGLGRWQEAREHIVAAARLRPNDFGTVQWAGQLLLQNGRNRDAARRYFEHARDLGSTAANPSGQLLSKGFPVFELWLDAQVDAAVSQFEALVPAMRAGSLSRVQRYGAGGFEQFIGNMYVLFGKLRAAEEAYQAITDERVKNQHLSYLAFARGDEANLKRYVLGYVRDPSARPGADSMSLLIRAGLFPEARGLLSVWQKDLHQRLPERSRYNGPYPFVASGVFFEYLKNLQGEIALSRGETVEAISYLEDGTDRLRTMGEGIFLPGSESLANGYERQGDIAGLLRVLEQASAEKLLLFRPRLEPVVVYWQRNQVRLARLYRKLGKFESAQRVEADLLKRLGHADADHPILRQLKGVDSVPGSRSSQ